jgi:hypothetical protein
MASHDFLILYVIYSKNTAYDKKLFHDSMPITPLILFSVHVVTNSQLITLVHEKQLSLYCFVYYPTLKYAILNKLKKRYGNFLVKLPLRENQISELPKTKKLSGICPNSS